MNITERIYTSTFDLNSLITKKSGFLFDDKFIYIFEKDPFREYSIYDIEKLKLYKKIKHKIRYFISNV
jgi:hypothetical protein